MPVRYFVFIVFLIASSCAHVGSEKASIIKYPAQLPESGSAVIFAPGLISSDSVEHSAPAFSPDGRTVLWSVMYMPSYRATILEMTFENDKWSAPHVVAFAESTTSDIYPAYTYDGKTVYFSSGRKLPDGKYPSRGNKLWRVHRTNDGWSSAEVLDSTISQGGDYAPSISADGKLYFTHGPFRSPDWNIRAIESVKPAAEFLSLGDSINSKGYEDGAFIAADNSYLIFESDRAGGKGGIDLWISFNTNSEWTLPINMGPKINTESAERFARVSPDGKFLFFGSDRRKINGKPNMDIYWIDAKVIEELRHHSSN